MSDLNQTSLHSVFGHRIREETSPGPGTAFPYLLGVELELENVEIPSGSGQLEGWHMVGDDSLRNGQEFVFSRPFRGESALHAVKRFYESGITSRNTSRTSTHIHVNVTDLKVGDVRAMFILSYALEGALFKVVADKRKYCGYCMPLSEMGPVRMQSLLCAEVDFKFVDAMSGSNADKYYGFNINSVRKHGTAELRYFPGGPSEEQLRTWMAYACDLRTAAVSTGIAGLIALESPDQFLRYVVDSFGDFGAALVESTGIDSMWAALQEVLAVLPDDSVVNRSQRLVFMSPTFSKFVSRHFLVSAHRVEHFLTKVVPLGVMSEEDWRVHYATSRSLRAAIEDPPMTEAEAAYQDTLTRRHAGAQTYMQFIRSRYWSDCSFGEDREMANRGILTQYYTDYLRANRLSAQPVVAASSYSNF